jgi:hypothetical protein
MVTSFKGQIEVKLQEKIMLRHFKKTLMQFETSQLETEDVVEYLIPIRLYFKLGNFAVYEDNFEWDVANDDNKYSPTNELSLTYSLASLDDFAKQIVQDNGFSTECYEIIVEQIKSQIENHFSKKMSNFLQMRSMIKSTPAPPPDKRDKRGKPPPPPVISMPKNAALLACTEQLPFLPDTLKAQPDMSTLEIRSSGLRKLLTKNIDHIADADLRQRVSQALGISKPTLFHGQ